MITLEQDTLVFRFPDVHRRASLEVRFQRTLRVPDDGREHHLPAGLGAFPLRHVDDHARGLPPEAIRRGGVLLPMHQAEALWIHFQGSWPMAVKVGAGKLCAISGEPWAPGLRRHPHQNYLVTPEQPWLDGFSVGDGVVRQFVAMPLGEGYTVEEQLTGRAETGGIQLQAYPLTREVWERERRRGSTGAQFVAELACADSDSMGLAPGGAIRQEVYEDRRPAHHWDLRRSSRCFVHLLNSAGWRSVTGEAPPPTPITREEYRRRGIPWFDFYRDDVAGVEGGGPLKGVRSVEELEGIPGGGPAAGAPIHLGPHRRPRGRGMREGRVVREGRI